MNYPRKSLMPSIMRCAMLFMAAMTASTAIAQKIDFDNGNNANYISTGYTSWNSFEVSTGGTASKTVGGVTITLSHGSGTQANLIKSNWYKNGVQSATATDESKLICDGIFAGMKNDDYGGYGITTAKVAVNVKVKGLAAGTHTIQAYHNYLNSSSATLPTIGVAVNGTTKQSGITQSQQATTLAAAAKSYVEFSVASTSDEVTITYFSEPSGGTSYNTTYFYINSLEIDVSSLDNQATDPSPSNYDWHAAHTGGSVTLSWTASANTPSSHTVYLGESESSMAQIYSGTATTCTATGLSPLKRYYWRVDETINGQTRRGEVWTFQPRRLAFPGAEGHGKWAVGGRGGTVYHVTSLADDGTAGTLRYGIESLTGPRTIVFDVAGVIQLKSRLACSDDFVTIAGQTAPGIGILVRDQDFAANSNDGITRFMRFRYGHGNDWDGTSANQNTGNSAGLIADHAIMDHCLLAWGSDEVFSSRGAKNITLQHTLIGEALNQNGHKKYYDSDHSVKHGYAATVGGEIASLHHNLLAHNEGRNWSLSGALDAANTFAGRLNIYNNVVYNWGGRATDGGAHQVNFVGNYYKKGPATTQNYIFSADHEDDFAGTQQYYLNGNYRVSQDGNTKTADKLNDTYRETFKNGVTISYPSFVSTPYDFYSIDRDNVETADAAFLNVLSDVGCNYASLDNNEQRLISETRDGTYSKTGSRSGKKGLIDKEADSENWDGLGMVEESRPAGWDTDGDGIPNWFETAKGWSVSAANNNDCDNAEYYTNLEEYLNWMATPHFTDLTEGTALDIDLTKYFAGYTSPTFSVAGSGITTSLSGSTLTVTPSAEGLASISVTATQGGISLTKTFNFHTTGSQSAVTEGDATYLVKKGDTFTSGQAIEVKDTDNDLLATIVYGENGGNAFTAATANSAVPGFEAFTAGNGTNGNNTGGTFYTITPVYNGKIEVAVVLNASKQFYITENGTALSDYNGITKSEKYSGTFTFSVSAGKIYKIYCSGSKLGFYGFNYHYIKTTEPDEPLATSHTWNFSNWTAQEISAQTTIDGLTVEAAATKKVTIASSSATVGGTTYTQALKFGGSGASNARNIHFAVPGKSKITIVAAHAKGSGDPRPLVMAQGTYGANTQSVDVPAETTAHTFTFAYLVDAETTIYIYSGNSGINLYEVSYEALSEDAMPIQVTLNKYGYSTFYYSDHNYDIPYGVAAMIVPEISKRNVVYSELPEVIPQSTAVVLEGTPNTQYTFFVSANTEASTTENMLRGSDSEQTTTGPDDSTDYKYYILSAKNSRVAFYYGSDNGAPFTNAAHKAYLAVPMAQASGVNAFFIDGADDTDDINDINVINDINDINDIKAPAYSISGQRVGAGYKGIVITNGKKMVRR